MADYKTMYFKLFNEVTTVIKTLQEMQVNSVINSNNSTTIQVSSLTAIIEKLQNIQATTEAMYIESEDKT